MDNAAASPSQTPNIRFATRSPFLTELRARVDEYFEHSEIPKRDPPRMYFKILVIVTWFVASWVFLVFYASGALQGVLGAMSLGLAIGGIGMCVMHDGNHGAVSDNPKINRLIGYGLDVMGVCSFIWRQRHNNIHHSLTNIQGYDEDLDFGWVARLATTQKLQPWQRFQHVYVWFLYMLLLPKWAFYDDFNNYRKLQLGRHKLTPFNRKEKALFWGWKAFFVSWSILIPAYYHPVWQVFIFHMIAVCTLGFTLSCTFQLAHVVEQATFPVVGVDKIDSDWGAHQLATTVDFARSNPILTWYMGGLNFQVEHHLFPRICHIHYPALSKIVEEVAAKHNIPYLCNDTLLGALGSHYRVLKRLRKLEIEVPTLVTQEAVGNG